MLSKKRDSSKIKTSVGGQALIEGVMMRGPKITAMAVRHTSGEIRKDKWETSGQSRPKILKLPFIRGIINFLDSMIFGYKCLMKSMEMSGMEDELVSENSKSPDDITPADDNILPDETVVSEEPSRESGEKQEGISKSAMTALMIVSAVLGVGLSVFLFMYLPNQLRSWLSGPLPALNGRVWRAFFEGGLRIILFLGYMIAVSFMKDIKRVFMYHGAEHKTIFCYESGQELTVENVRGQIRFHPRCGTSFMFLMLFIGIGVSIFITANNPFVRTGIKLLTIPIVVSIGYEFIKLAGKSDNILVRIISTPGLWVQRITTKEPTDDMIEVAICSFNMALPDDGSDKL